MPPAVLQCPQCGRLSETYSTLNDRVAVCPPCAASLKARLTTLTTAAILKGVGAGILVAFAVVLLVDLVVFSMDRKSEAAGWISAISAVFMGLTVGRTARRAAGTGGRWLQVLTVAITYVAISEVFVPHFYRRLAENGNTHPAALLAVCILGAPLVFPLLLVGHWSLLFFLFWGIYDPWRTTGAAVIELKGPFPVHAPAAPPNPEGLPAPAAPPPAADAKAAGLDFERPA